jgi:hypothetical protein
LEEIDNNFFNYYEDRYPGLLRTSPMTAEDDRASNTITLKERYFLPKPALFENGLGEDFLFVADDFARFIRDSAKTPRRAPLLVGSERVYRHVINVRNAPLDFAPPEDLRLSNPAFLFTFNGSGGQYGNMTLDWLFRTRNRSVEPEQIARILADAEVVKDNYYYSWTILPEATVAR